MLASVGGENVASCLVGFRVDLRRAAVSDAQTIALHRYPALGPDDEDVTTYAAWVAEAMARGLYLGWLAEQDGHIVAGSGLLLLEWGPTKQDSHPWRGRVVNVFAAPSVRRQGIARRLLEEVMHDARRRGIRTLSLATSDMARGLYEQAGFSPSISEMLRRSNTEVGR